MTDNELIISSYKAALKDLRKRHKDMDPEHPDKKTISGMISNMEYSLFWLINGHERPPVDPSITRLSKDKREVLWGEIEHADRIGKGVWEVYSWEENENERMTDNRLEMLRDASAIIGTFSNQELNVFVLKYANLLSIDEIAKQLNLSNKAIYTTSDRINKRIEKYFESQYTEQIAIFA
ncbi:hypothetical protein ACODG4_04285 [Vagococcus fluvialis]|uniref:hypothetical protein n=1 Tax=Vagococcus fluvialis TaxID=2738 RepID=UPI003B5AB41C